MDVAGEQTIVKQVTRSGQDAAPGAAAKVIGPSRIARYYFHECDRFLRYAATPSAERASEGVPKPPVDTRPVTRAILESGYAWEEEVVSSLIPGRIHLGPETDGGSLSDRMFGADEARRVLCSMRAGEWIYQPELEVPGRFYERYGHDRELIAWSRCRPDLIEAVEAEDGRLELRVIDIKASPGVKLAHRIQATLYSLILAALLEEWGVEDRQVAGEAGVWLAQHAESEYSDLRALTPPIEQFLRHQLPALMAAPAAEAPWHLYFRCEWCEWFDHCRAEMRATDSVSRIPYLSTHAKRFLEGAAPPVRTIPDLRELLEDQTRHDELDACASLRGRAGRLATQVDALKDDEVKSYGGSSLAMPRIENVRLVLTAQTEPVSGQLYAFGIYAQGLKDVIGQKTRIRVEVAPTGDQAAIDALERTLVHELWLLFGAVADYNGDHSTWSEQKSLQAYVFDSYERDLVVGALMRRLLDPEVAECALRLLFHFQGPDLVQAEEHPAGTVSFPMVVLTDILRQQLALPAEVSYRFEDAVRLMAPSQFAFDYNDNPYFAFELSNQVRSDAIYGAWYEGKAERVDAIGKELRIRLFATNSVVNGTRERLERDGALFAYPPKLELAGSFGLGSALLSRLAFLTQYEAVLGYLDVRLRRMAPLSERIAAGDAVLLRYVGGDRFAIAEIGEDLELGAEPFPKHLLAAVDDEGERALLSYDDWFNRARVWVPKHARLRVGGITHVAGTPPREVRLALEAGASSPELVSEGRYVLGARFTDFNGRHVLSELREIDVEPDPPFLRLLATPKLFAEATDVSPAIRETAIALATDHGMTTSQLEAFAGMLDRRLQLVWGPPGTGKTHFLALAILCLAEAQRRAGESFQVYVTAFTHAAIENVLRKLAELQADRAIVGGNLAVGKHGQIRRDAGVGTKEVATDGATQWLSAHVVAVLGGTVWAARRMDPGCADLMVIDEASQLRVPESAIAVRRLAERGRLVVAGDDKQLPPIVQGAYPEPEEGGPLLHRSLFECLRSAPDIAALTATLLENFRMNQTLCRFPAEQVYVPDYKPANEEIARRRLRLQPGSGGWTELVLDPAYPLVIGVLDGVQATAENPVEASLTADVAYALRESLLDLDGNVYDDDGLFWRDGLFVVSPHHAQIRAIRRELAVRRDWQSRPFVDTVDKMQGQECDAVIVSYGVADVEYALNEKEFIYSLNRLNVAITRGRAKTICFLPQPLLEPPVAAFEDDRIAEGIGFMQGLWRFAERDGEHRLLELDAGAVLHLYRVPEHVRSESQATTENVT